MNDLTPPDLSLALEQVGSHQSADVLTTLLRVFHGLIGAKDAALSAGVTAELEHEIRAYRKRGHRLEETLDADPVLSVNSPWVNTDFIAQLDAVARFASACSLKAVTGESEAAQVMATFLNEVLYDHLGALAKRRGWFLVEKIVAFESNFDATIHKALGAKNLTGHAGKVSELSRVGLKTEKGELLRAAHVVAAQ